MEPGQQDRLIHQNLLRSYFYICHPTVFIAITTLQKKNLAVKPFEKYQEKSDEIFTD